MDLTRRSFALSLGAGLAVPRLALASPDVLRDQAYGSHPKQAVDVYLPTAPQNAPILIAVHGGGWRMGDKGNRRFWRGKVRHWGERGYIVVSVNYRLLPESHPLEQAADVARAIAFVQQNAARWGGNAGAVAVMGHSAGAHLVSLLAAAPTLAAKYGAQPWRATVSLDTAVFDLEAVMQDDPVRTYRNAFGTDPAFWRQASPLAQLGRRTAPFLLVCSSQRRKSCPAAEAFAAAIRGKGGQATVLPVALSHSSINSELGSTGDYTGAVDGFLNAAGLP